MSTWISTLIFSFFLNVSFGSFGDQSPFYVRCVRSCVKDICDQGKHDLIKRNLVNLGITLWTCTEDCEYKCQWMTVEAFQRQNFSIPKFHGKWPFIRLFGLQEPASVIFSLFNFAVHVTMIFKFREQISANTPFYNVWHLNTLINLNAWFWSAVFHTRDTSFTEKMDYISGFCVVIFSMYAMGLRFISTLISLKSFLWTFLCLSLALTHIYYLWSEIFDFGYNMKLNCGVGVLTGLGWLAWTIIHFRSQPYAWWVTGCSLCLGLAASLEILDFPPILWFFDPHSLWHLSTGFIILLFYKFIILDCKYIADQMHEHIE